MDQFLSFIGLAKRSSLVAAQTEAEKCRAYAEVVTTNAKTNGVIIVSGDYTNLNGCYAIKIIVPPWVKYTSIVNCSFIGDASI